jgi:polyhydroxyalkanoate synthase
MLAHDNAMTRPGDFAVLGTPIDLGKVDVDSYIVAGSTDHIVPWRNAYRTTQLLGGEPRFILSTSGHIQALINPDVPDSRSSFRVAPSNPESTSDWEAEAVTKRGSWWPDYVEWLRARSGEMLDAPETLGSRQYKATAKAPGTYVMAN